MAETAPLHVQMIAKTEFFAPPDVPWSTDADGGEALVESADVMCWSSVARSLESAADRCKRSVILPVRGRY